MAHGRVLFLILLMVLLAVPSAPVNASGPEGALRDVAAALRAKDITAFREAVDVASLFDADFAAGYKGGEDVPFMPFKGQATDNLLEKVASGEFARECAEAVRPGCPWYPAGLDKAIVTLTDAASAIAAIDSAKDIRTWLVLHNIEGQWRVIAAPNRYLVAERYASDAFQETMRNYVAALDDSFKKKAEREAQYKEGAAKAVEKAARMLATVTIRDIRFAIEETSYDARLIVTATAVNGYTEQLRPTGVEITITDGGGNFVELKKFTASTGFIEPGSSAALRFTTGIRGEREYDAARKLAGGGHKAAGRVSSMLVGTRNLLVNETGGGLLPPR